MAKLTVSTSSVAREIVFSPGKSAREVLEGAGVWVRTGCRGDGACGLCLVQVEAGEIPAPTRNERLLLLPDQLAQNFRLACQLTPKADLQLRIANPVLKATWRDLAEDSLLCTPSFFSPLAEGVQSDGSCGLAIDLGTTQISYSVWDLKQRRRLHSRVGPNPQSPYGSDIVTRLLAADESPENAWRLARLPLEAVADDLRELCAGDDSREEKVAQAAIVGNSAMLALLTGEGSLQLLQPGRATRPVAPGAATAQTWVSFLGIHPGGLEVVPPLAGFVGSDLLAGVIATRLTDQPGSLLIDFGTNSEMALWDGQDLWVTSVAGGPAFESSGIQCGMPAEPGAIYRFGRSEASDRLDFEVLGGGDAKGFCGSGLVDLIACLRDWGELTSTGNFANPRHRGVYLLQTDPTIKLTKGDVDAFQRAKAAVGTGIGTLLAQARLHTTGLNRICVGGVFGQNLHIRNAQRIGLLPDVLPGQVELCGNTALTGCERLLLSSASTEELARLRNRSSTINLSQSSDFDARFLDNLYLQPLKVKFA